MLKNVLKKARRLYRRKKFDQAIRLLESQIFRFRNSPDFYFLLGSACLYSGDSADAASYLKRAAQINPNNINILLGLAATDLKRSEIEEAVKKWLKILDLDPWNRAAGRGLELARRGLSPEDIPDFVESGKMRRLFPPLPFNPLKLLLPVMSLLTALAILAGGVFLLPRFTAEREGRPGVTDISLSAEHPPLINNSGEYPITLSEEEIKQTFNRAKSYLLQYQDNLALRETNRIILSNASAYVKERARLLKSFVQEPDFSTIKDSFSFREVAENPPLYEGCYVVWAGKAANVQIGGAAITFDLLVGYQQEEELLGIVPVVLDFAADLENGDAVEILGKIRFKETLVLGGISIHKLLGSEL
ncbi:hypothetical protein ES703_47404 [subsurface metagenome]